MNVPESVTKTGRFNFSKIEICLFIFPTRMNRPFESQFMLPTQMNRRLESRFILSADSDRCESRLI